MMPLREDAYQIIREAIASVRPDRAVLEALDRLSPGSGRLILVAAGKAAWQMAHVAQQRLQTRIDSGIVVTKYGHSNGPIPGLTVWEAGHPTPDAHSYAATRAVLDMTANLFADDTVLLLLSGGGSALFELPLIPSEDLLRLTRELLACGASIEEINTVRKRFSAVKGGRFALACRPARVVSILLSDVLGDRADLIASGPACPDPTTAAMAQAVFDRYGLTRTPQMDSLLLQETPKTLDNVETHIVGSVRQLCASAAETCRTLGYEPIFLTDRLSCTARDAGVFLADIASSHAGRGKRLAFLAGGETVVRLTGSGKGGRNQELALAAAEGIAQKRICIFSVGSDGTDGPTDAAGGIVDGQTFDRLCAQGVQISRVLQDNDAYHALKKCDGLIQTGPTGTNVNDLAVALIDG